MAAALSDEEEDHAEERGYDNEVDHRNGEYYDDGDEQHDVGGMTPRRAHLCTPFVISSF